MRYPACHESLSSITLMNRFSRASGNLRDHLHCGRSNIPVRVPAMGSSWRVNCHFGAQERMAKFDGLLMLSFMLTTTKQTHGLGFRPLA
jgi:hypothetical protein